MFDNPRIFRRSDPDFPTTPAVQRRLVEAGRVQRERPLASPRNAGQQCRQGESTDLLADGQVSAGPRDRRGSRLRRSIVPEGASATDMRCTHST